MTGIATLVLAIATVAMVIVLVVTAIFVYRGLDDARKNRHGILITDIARRWDEPQIVKAFKLQSRYTEDDLLKLVDAVWAGGTNQVTTEQLRDFFILTALPNLFDTIGALHRDGAIDIDIVDRMWGASIKDQWTIWRAPVWRMRGISRTNSYYREFERLNLVLIQHWQTPEESDTADAVSVDGNGGR
jgi:hypothetical protein